ncbi:MAG: glucose 1-dehydrogenase [Actinobacteria bacterium]|nr:glucose 1-dehydrogenase [Actinomycetota bacterium]
MPEVASGDLNGTIAIVTGGARGQGAAFVEELHRLGAKVVIADLLAAEGDALADRLGDRVVFVAHDVSDPESWERVVAETTGAFGGLTALVNNAGINRPRTLLETDAENWHDHLAVNQTGPFLGMKTAAAEMAAGGGGSIVNICSGSSLRGAPKFFAYSAAKWALRGMSRSAAHELAPLGIRVNAIFPGLIETEMLGASGFTDTDRALKLVPLRRLGSPADVAGAVAFLVGPASAYVTGAELVVDGGMFA